MGTRSRGRQGEFPPFPAPATRCGLSLGSSAAGGGADRGGRASSGLATEAFAWLDPAALCIHCKHSPGSHCHGNTGNGAGSGQPEHSDTENGISVLGAGLCSQGLWLPRDVAAPRRSLCPGAPRDVSPKQRRNEVEGTNRMGHTGKREQWEGDFSGSAPGMDGARIFVLQPGIYSHGDYLHIPRHFNLLGSPLNSLPDLSCMYCETQVDFPS